MTYGTDRRGSVPPYSIARQFYSPRPPTHIPSVGVRSTWANWLAYNMGMTEGLDSIKLLFNQGQCVKNYFFIETKCIMLFQLLLNIVY